MISNSDARCNCWYSRLSADRGDHGSGRHRGARELVKITAILFDAPLSPDRGQGAGQKTASMRTYVRRYRPRPGVSRWDTTLAPATAPVRVTPTSSSMSPL